MSETTTIRLSFIVVSLLAVVWLGLGLYAMNAGLAANGEVHQRGLIEALDEIDIQFVNSDGQNRILLNGVDVEGEIRSMAVSSLVSLVSKIAEVRTKLRTMQQTTALGGGVVMDGRDIGSAVLPNAELKIFMSATPEIRAGRRYKELHAKGVKISLEDVKTNLEDRDRIDTGRAENPLTRVPEAVLLDNSALSETEQLQMVLTWAEQIIGKP